MITAVVLSSTGQLGEFLVFGSSACHHQRPSEQLGTPALLVRGNCVGVAVGDICSIHSAFESQCFQSGALTGKMLRGPTAGLGTGRHEQQQAHGNGKRLSKQFPLSYGTQARSTLAVT